MLLRFALSLSSTAFQMFAWKALPSGISQPAGWKSLPDDLVYTLSSIITSVDTHLPSELTDYR